MAGRGLLSTHRSASLERIDSGASLESTHSGASLERTLSGASLGTYSLRRFLGNVFIPALVDAYISQIATVRKRIINTVKSELRRTSPPSCRLVSPLPHSPKRAAVLTLDSPLCVQPSPAHIRPSRSRSVPFDGYARSHVRAHIAGSPFKRRLALQACCCDAASTAQPHARAPPCPPRPSTR